jgi:hypothetical protein
LGEDLKGQKFRAIRKKRKTNRRETGFLGFSKKFRPKIFPCGGVVGRAALFRCAGATGHTIAVHAAGYDVSGAAFSVWVWCV